MRVSLTIACITALMFLAFGQPPAVPPKSSATHETTKSSAESAMKSVFEAKVKAEWDALKNKDKRAYADLLADDYEGVEVDGSGERTKIQSLNELPGENVYDYTLWGFKMIPVGPDAAFVIYEVTMEFPPKSKVRYSRVYISELWVKRAGQWKEVHYQETHVK